VLGITSAAGVARFQRSAMLEVVRQDYIRTARAKGLSEGAVIGRHALRNALIPVITLLGLSLPFLVSGAVITETIFAWPGVGRLSVQAIYNRDYPLVQASVFVLASIFVLVNLAVDLVYTYLDPRIRLG
jgi:ABC-type dipeptide/oligopeptide/nickel transport system permease component